METLDANPRHDPPPGIDPPSDTRGGPVPSRLHRVDSEQLLRGAREIEILHGQALYRLRHTASGKLILTK